MYQRNPCFSLRHPQCYCGVAADDPARLGDARCSIPCAGDATQVCGGFNAISVYEFVDTVDIEPENLGCWRDTRNDRIMEFEQSDSSMTNEVSRSPLPPR